MSDHRIGIDDPETKIVTVSVELLVGVGALCEAAGSRMPATSIRSLSGVADAVGKYGAPGIVMSSSWGVQAQRVASRVWKLVEPASFETFVDSTASTPVECGDLG